MIEVTRGCSEQQIDELGIRDWPIWSCDASTFPWEYSDRERCLQLEGDVTVTPEQGPPVRFGAGDLVEFSPGLQCTWQVHKAVRKHYCFG